MKLVLGNISSLYWFPPSQPILVKHKFSRTCSSLVGCQTFKNIFSVNFILGFFHEDYKLKFTIFKGTLKEP